MNNQSTVNTKTMHASAIKEYKTTFLFIIYSYLYNLKNKRKKEKEFKNLEESYECPYYQDDPNDER